MQQAEEEALILAAQNGNQKAFEIIFRRYQRPLLRYAFRVSSDKSLAEEAVQNAWIKFARNIRKLHDPRAFRSWLYKSVHWQLVDLGKASLRRRQLEEPFEEEMHGASQDDRDEVEEIGAAINRLPKLERQMIHLFYQDELQINEISAVLDIPAGTVKSRLNRARKIFKERFSS